MDRTKTCRPLLLGTVVAGMCISAIAQASHQWARVIGGSGADTPVSVQPTSDGGYIVAGYTSGSFGPDQDVWLIKLDSTGSVTWQKTYGGAGGGDTGIAVRQTNDGGYYLGCHSSAFGNGREAWVLRLDPVGNVLWQRTYGGASDDYLYSLELTDDGGCVFAGETNGFGASGTNAWMVKLASDGTVTWARRRYLVNQYESAKAIRPDGSGGYVLVCSGMGSGGDDDVWFMRLDSNGGPVTNNRHLIGAVGRHETPKAVDPSGDGGWFIAGEVSVAGNAYDGLLVKVSSSGSPIWQKHVGGATSEYFNEGQSTSDGGYVAVGRTFSPTDGSGDIWVVKFDSSGQVTWQKTYGGTSGEWGYDIRQTSDGGYVVIGESQSYGNSIEAGIIRLSPTGEIDPSCGGLAENVALASADWVVSDQVNPISWSASTNVTVATPAYVTNLTNGTNTALCSSACRVSCSAQVPASAVVGIAASFTSSATLVDCGGGAVSYSWAFGDGMTAAEQNPSYAYAIPGVYTWTLNVTAPGASPCMQSGSITISATAVPDLTGAWTAVKKKKSKVTATFSCQNIDLGDAGSFTVKIYSSKRSTLSKRSKLIKTQTVPSIGAGGVYPITFKVTLQNRHKYLLAFVDPGSTVSESNETNNSIAQALP